MPVCPTCGKNEDIMEMRPARIHNQKSSEQLNHPVFVLLWCPCGTIWSEEGCHGTAFWDRTIWEQQ